MKTVQKTEIDAAVLYVDPYPLAPQAQLMLTVVIDKAQADETLFSEGDKVVVIRSGSKESVDRFLSRLQELREWQKERGFI